MARVERVFPADHPSAFGHFPGNPVIPGAVLLGEALLTIEAGLELRPCRIRFAKFLAPVRPGERVSIDYSRDAGTIHFTCEVGGRTVVRGEVTCDVTPVRK